MKYLFLFVLLFKFSLSLPIEDISWRMTWRSRSTSLAWKTEFRKMSDMSSTMVPRQVSTTLA